MVSGGTSQPGADPDADGEVALDVQVAGAGAPGAKLAVYFAPNTDQGFADAISSALHEADRKPAVMTISRGGPESTWTDQAVAAMSAALQDAAELGHPPIGLSTLVVGLTRASSTGYLTSL